MLPTAITSRRTFDDSVRDRLGRRYARQHHGPQQRRADHDIGSLGLGTNLNGFIGFDISATGTGYASITTGGISRLYTVNLTTGAATLLGAIGSGWHPFLGLTVTPVPEPGTMALAGVVAAGALWRRYRRGQQ